MSPAIINAAGQAAVKIVKSSNTGRLVSLFTKGIPAVIAIAKGAPVTDAISEAVETASSSVETILDVPTPKGFTGKGVLTGIFGYVIEAFS